ncbi:nucleolar MIF4G domain-containing protein 1 isoform X1 [Heterocephalus glaber]|uniref:Nucleolar MIF4G domain-containing protein 1 n=1 Tax=Heterocephalus glaber TaxID=10181 RepID=A0A0P6J0D2_HETGA|nr:nucleolar MIF4G domain-containing protein 1 isoform X1 [Heterocephalus glaber]XP_021096484.1 nucleolar MIF4G domain-containing protein 1 isoform X1 [Heterocephalus glaber]
MVASLKLVRRGRRRGTRLKRGSDGLGGEGALKRLKLAVEGFVRATSEAEAPGGFEGRGAAVSSRPIGRKSRKELRREKRQLRKARRLQRAGGPGPAREEGSARPPSRAREAEAAPSHCKAKVKTSPAKPKAPPASAPSAHSKAKATRTKGPSLKAEARPRKTEPSATARKRALLAANEEEDREIRKLERCLGLNKRRKKGDGSSVPLSFARDGLDYILGALEPGAGGSGLYESSGEEDEEEEESGEDEIPPDSDSNLDVDSERESEEDLEGEAHPSEDEVENVEDADDSVDPEPGGGVEGGARETRGRKRVRFAKDEDLKHESSEVENTSHQESLCENSEKYIPSQVRCIQETVDVRKKVELERLKKQVKGLINRLSEPNMAFISGQLEELYMAHSRKDMSDMLTATLMDACVTSSAMPSRLMMEHILLVSILHHTVGIEVGACFLEGVVRRFDDAYGKGGEGKECDNLVTIVAHLYNFHVVQSLLVFDILRKLIGTFTEKDIELILLMLKNVGFSLRKDNALSLKELIAEAQAKASTTGSKFQDQTRIRFMLETMLALKNNDMRKIPGYDPEPVERLRKLQRALVRSAGSGSETQLRISWDGILKAEQTGRWWIVGSAWSGAPMIDNSRHAAPQKPLAGTVSAKMLELARKQRMNTDVRRNIFCTVMTSEDFLDAFEKLLKLGLKDQQEREIVHVLMDCCLQEKTYNPFYAFLASKFCGYERRFQMTFQFSIWDKFRDLENLPATNFLNLVQLVAHLLKTKSLPLSILKVVEFSELDKPRVHFLRRVLTVLLMETEVEDLSLIFSRVSDNPKLGVLREGLKLFISHFLLRHAQAQQCPEEAGVLRERAGLATKALQGRAALQM